MQNFRFFLEFLVARTFVRLSSLETSHCGVSTFVYGVSFLLHPADAGVNPTHVGVIAGLTRNPPKGLKKYWEMDSPSSP